MRRGWSQMRRGMGLEKKVSGRGQIRRGAWLGKVGGQGEMENRVQLEKWGCGQS